MPFSGEFYQGKNARKRLKYYGFDGKCLIYGIAFRTTGGQGAAGSSPVTPTIPSVLTGSEKVM